MRCKKSRLGPIFFHDECCLHVVFQEIPRIAVRLFQDGSVFDRKKRREFQAFHRILRDWRDIGLGKINTNELGEQVQTRNFHLKNFSFSVASYTGQRDWRLLRAQHLSSEVINFDCHTKIC